VWAGDERLVMYELNVPRGELSQKWIKDEGDAVVAPLVQRGNTLFHARQPRGASGLAVAATQISIDRGGQGQDGQRQWETEVAVPSAGPAMVDASSQRIVTVSSHGAVFDIDARVLREGITDRPAGRLPAAGQALSFVEPVPLGQGRFAFTSVSDPRRILVYDPRGKDRRIHVENVPIPAEDQALAPVAMGGSLLFPTRAGPVYLVNVEAAGPPKRDVYPFLPRLTPGRKIDWQRPAVSDELKGQFAIADTSGQLYLVQRNDEPPSHLAAQAQRDLNGEVVSPLAVVGATGYAALRTEGQRLLASFQLPELTLGPRWPLDGHVVWGPERVGDVALVATDAGQLMCLSAGGQQRWTAPLVHGGLAGRPLAMNQTFVLASDRGTLWRVDSETGQAIDWGPAAGDGTPSDRFEVGEPLGAGPVAFGDQLLLVGRDGTLYVTPQPKREDSSSEARQES
jgi:hypothetical protein